MLTSTMLPFLGVRSVHRAQQHQAGVVHQDVETAELLVACSTNAFASSSLLTSVGIATARPPSASIRFASASIRSARRAASATAAPAPASDRAVASPMPGRTLP